MARLTASTTKTIISKATACKYTQQISIRKPQMSLKPPPQSQHCNASLRRDLALPTSKATCKTWLLPLSCYRNEHPSCCSLLLPARQSRHHGHTSCIQLSQIPKCT